MIPESFFFCDSCRCSWGRGHRLGGSQSQLRTQPHERRRRNDTPRGATQAMEAAAGHGAATGCRCGGAHEPARWVDRIAILPNAWRFFLGHFFLRLLSSLVGTASVAASRSSGRSCTSAASATTPLAARRRMWKRLLGTELRQVAAAAVPTSRHPGASIAPSAENSNAAGERNPFVGSEDADCRQVRSC